MKTQNYVKIYGWFFDKRKSSVLEQFHAEPMEVHSNHKHREINICCSQRHQQEIVPVFTHTHNH